MKLTRVLALCTLIVTAKGNLVAAIARPVILSIGTVYTALKTQDALSGAEPTDWRNLIPFSTKKVFEPDYTKSKPEKCEYDEDGNHVI